MSDLISRQAECLVEQLPPVDTVEVVRCQYCKHRIENKYYGISGHMIIKAMCELDTGDPYALGRNAEDDEWFCKDGERREK